MNPWGVLMVVLVALGVGLVLGLEVRHPPPETVYDTTWFNAPDSIWGPHLEVNCWIVNREGFEFYGELRVPR